jgi:threonine/homoserine/homoserine lactone efflux protein
VSIFYRHTPFFAIISAMAFTTFLNVIGIGFTVAAAVGPISLLCIERTLRRGWRFGMSSGFGVATADALYGLIGGLGLTVVTNFLVRQQTVLRLVGGVVLVFLGLRTLLSKSDLKAAEERSSGVGGYLSAYTSIFLLTLSNPMTIISFAAIYAGIGNLGLGSNWVAAAVFCLAIFIGSSLWWLVLVSGVNQLRSRFKPALLVRLNRISGLVIAGFGVVILLQVLLS